MQKLKLLVCCLFLTSAAFSQNSTVIKDYVEKYKDIAIEEMVRTGVPAAIKLAQGIHETEAGRSKLCIKSNNHFGIKCKSEWKGEWVSHDDDAKGECFRKYGDPADSYRDHSDFLKTRAHYASLFKLDPADYEGWAYGLKKAGYATNPKYPQLIIKLIRDYDLQQYTLQGIAKMNGVAPAQDAVIQVVSTDESSSQAKEVRRNGSVSYPAGLFTINETEVIYATEGTSFLSIADKYNIPLARLFEYNDRSQAEAVEFDQLVYLQRKRSKGSNSWHVVKAGETPHDVAQAEGIRLESLLEFNELQANDDLQEGRKLYLQAKAPAKVETRKSSKESFEVHKVKAQETIFAISKKYGVTIDDILKWNDLEDTVLKIGQELKIRK